MLFFSRAVYLSNVFKSVNKLNSDFRTFSCWDIFLGWFCDSVCLYVVHYLCCFETVLLGFWCYGSLTAVVADHFCFRFWKDIFLCVTWLCFHFLRCCGGHFSQWLRHVNGPSVQLNFDHTFSLGIWVTSSDCRNCLFWDVFCLVEQYVPVNFLVFLQFECCPVLQWFSLSDGWPQWYLLSTPMFACDFFLLPFKLLFDWFWLLDLISIYVFRRSTDTFFVYFLTGGAFACFERGRFFLTPMAEL